PYSPARGALSNQVHSARSGYRHTRVRIEDAVLHCTATEPATQTQTRSDQVRHSVPDRHPDDSDSPCGSPRPLDGLAPAGGETAHPDQEAAPAARERQGGIRQYFLRTSRLADLGRGRSQENAGEEDKGPY